MLTNEHVVGGSKNVNLLFLDGREIRAEVLASDAQRDVALLKSDSAGPRGMPLQIQAPPISSRVFVIGSPGVTGLQEPLPGTVTSGIVSAFREIKNRGPFIQSDVAVTHGNSGGPMFDDKGNVIGMTDLGFSADGGGTANINMFIPIADALRVLKIEVAPAAQAAAK